MRCAVSIRRWTNWTSFKAVAHCRLSSRLLKLRSITVEYLSCFMYSCKEWINAAHLVSVSWYHTRVNLTFRGITMTSCSSTPPSYRIAGVGSISRFWTVSDFVSKCYGYWQINTECDRAACKVWAKIHRNQIFETITTFFERSEISDCLSLSESDTCNTTKLIKCRWTHCVPLKL